MSEYWQNNFNIANGQMGGNYLIPKEVLFKKKVYKGPLSNMFIDYIADQHFLFKKNLKKQKVVYLIVDENFQHNKKIINIGKYLNVQLTEPENKNYIEIYNAKVNNNLMPSNIQLHKISKNKYKFQITKKTGDDVFRYSIMMNHGGTIIPFE